MRNACFTMIPLAMAALMFGVGCQQTTGTGGAGSIGTLGGTPLGSLTPVPAGQSAPLGPFGGTTRVTPPPTRSASGGSASRLLPGGSGTTIAPNNYLGAPVSQNQLPSDAFKPNRLSELATSAVEQAGFTETNARLASAQPNSSTTRDPRAGGMRTIDLTTAVNPNQFASHHLTPHFDRSNPTDPGLLGHDHRAADPRGPNQPVPDPLGGNGFSAANQAGTFAGTAPGPIPFRGEAFGSVQPTPLQNSFTPSSQLPLSLAPSSLPTAAASTLPNFGQPRSPLPPVGSSSQVQGSVAQPLIANEQLNWRRPASGSF